MIFTLLKLIKLKGSNAIFPYTYISCFPVHPQMWLLTVSFLILLLSLNLDYRPFRICGFTIPAVNIGSFQLPDEHWSHVNAELREICTGNRLILSLPQSFIRTWLIEWSDADKSEGASKVEDWTEAFHLNNEELWVFHALGYYQYWCPYRMHKNTQVILTSDMLTNPIFMWLSDGRFELDLKISFHYLLTMYT